MPFLWWTIAHPMAGVTACDIAVKWPIFLSLKYSNKIDLKNFSHKMLWKRKIDVKRGGCVNYAAIMIAMSVNYAIRELIFMKIDHYLPDMYFLMTFISVSWNSENHLKIIFDAAVLSSSYSLVDARNAIFWPAWGYFSTHDKMISVINKFICEKELTRLLPVARHLSWP